LFYPGALCSTRAGGAGLNFGGRPSSRPLQKAAARRTSQKRCPLGGGSAATRRRSRAWRAPTFLRVLRAVASDAPLIELRPDDSTDGAATTRPTPPHPHAAPAPTAAPPSTAPPPGTRLRSPAPR